MVRVRHELALRRARVGKFEVQAGDIVFADDDGCLFVTEDRVEELLTTARAIWQQEREQAEKVVAGQTLGEQFEFTRYLEQRAADMDYTFREHLRKISGAMEE